MGFAGAEGRVRTGAHPAHPQSVQMRTGKSKTQDLPYRSVCFMEKPFTPHQQGESAAPGSTAASALLR